MTIRWLTVRLCAAAQADLTASLAARVELLREEADRAAEESGQGDAGVAPGGDAHVAAHPLRCALRQLVAAGGCELALPRRVLLPWKVGRGSICSRPGGTGAARGVGMPRPRTALLSTQ
jgi:hypothetical protein